MYKTGFISFYCQDAYIGPIYIDDYYIDRPVVVLPLTAVESLFITSKKKSGGLSCCSHVYPEKE